MTKTPFIVFVVDDATRRMGAIDAAAVVASLVLRLPAIAQPEQDLNIRKLDAAPERQRAYAVDLIGVEIELESAVHAGATTFAKVPNGQQGVWL